MSQFNSGLVQRIQRSLAGISWAVQFFLKLRNQCNIIIGYSLAPDHIFSRNGESDFLQTLKGTIETFVDVGANKGDWTEEVIALNPVFKTGILLEPNPDCKISLEGKFRNYSNIQIVEAACSDVAGTAVFFAEEGGGETSSLSNAGTHGARVINVQVTTIDELVSARNLDKIDYLKIDVEGFDFHVLKGAHKTLQNGIIEIIQFEYNKTWRNNGSTLSHAFSFLSGCGYTTWCLTNKGLKAFDIESFGDYFAYSNFIALKNK